MMMQKSQFSGSLVPMSYMLSVDTNTYISTSHDTYTFYGLPLISDLLCMFVRNLLTCLRHLLQIACPALAVYRHFRRLQGASGRLRRSNCPSSPWPLLGTVKAYTPVSALWATDHSAHASQIGHVEYPSAMYQSQFESSVFIPIFLPIFPFLFLLLYFLPRTLPTVS